MVEKKVDDWFLTREQLIEIAKKMAYTNVGNNLFGLAGTGNVVYNVQIDPSPHAFTISYNARTTITEADEKFAEIAKLYKKNLNN